LDEDKEEEDDNKCYRNQVITDANKEYTPRQTIQRNGNGNENQLTKYSELELELTPELKQAEIVNRFAYYTKTNAIQVLPNYHYNCMSYGVRYYTQIRV
jgi:hypothetical protein